MSHSVPQSHLDVPELTSQGFDPHFTSFWASPCSTPIGRFQSSALSNLLSHTYKQGFNSGFQLGYTPGQLEPSSADNCCSGTMAELATGVNESASLPTPTEGPGVPQTLELTPWLHNGSHQNDIFYEGPKDPLAPQRFDPDYTNHGFPVTMSSFENGARQLNATSFVHGTESSTAERPPSPSKTEQSRDSGYSGSRYRESTHTVEALSGPMASPTPLVRDGHDEVGRPSPATSLRLPQNDFWSALVGRISSQETRRSSQRSESDLSSSMDNQSLPTTSQSSPQTEFPSLKSRGSSPLADTEQTVEASIPSTTGEDGDAEIPTPMPSRSENLTPIPTSTPFGGATTNQDVEKPVKNEPKDQTENGDDLGTGQAFTAAFFTPGMPREIIDLTMDTDDEEPDSSETQPSSNNGALDTSWGSNDGRSLRKRPATVTNCPSGRSRKKRRTAPTTWKPKSPSQPLFQICRITLESSQDGQKACYIWSLTHACWKLTSESHRPGGLTGAKLARHVEKDKVLSIEGKVNSKEKVLLIESNGDFEADCGSWAVSVALHEVLGILEAGTPSRKVECWVETKEEG